MNNNTYKTPDSRFGYPTNWVTLSSRCIPVGLEDYGSFILFGPLDRNLGADASLHVREIRKLSVADLLVAQLQKRFFFLIKNKADSSQLMIGKSTKFRGVLHCGEVRTLTLPHFIQLFFWFQLSFKNILKRSCRSSAYFLCRCWKQNFSSYSTRAFFSIFRSPYW